MTHRYRCANLLLLTQLLIITSATAQVVPGTLDVHWNAGAKDCAATPQPPLQVHEYEPQTFILRQSPCADFEANFLYLLIGSNKALLIDTGAVAESSRMPLATTVLKLLPEVVGARLPLLVVHSHKHLDHRAGDGQFQGLPGVQLVPADLDSVRAFFGISQWPEGVSHIDLGGRIVDVLPAPGHQFCHVVFYDNRTALVFSGDFLIPGRLLVDDATAYRQSAVRLIDFLQNRPVSHILGGHIELNAQGDTYWFGTTYHPNERALALSKEDLLALPAAFDHFNGFYAPYPDFVLFHSTRILIVEAIAALALLTAVVWGLILLWKRLRRTARNPAPTPQSA
jgi:glyoxylase-like metal-dependent hydrolase (beta-lactamase superfamily II)